MFHMLNTTVRGAVNIQHVPTFARLGGQHVVNICSSRPLSYSRSPMARKTAQNRPNMGSKSLKIAQNRSKSLLVPHNRDQLSTCSNICRAADRVNIQHLFQHLQVMVVNIQHQQLRRFRQHFSRRLFEPHFHMGVFNTIKPQSFLQEQSTTQLTTHTHNNHTTSPAEKILRGRCTDD